MNRIRRYGLACICICICISFASCVGTVAKVAKNASAIKTVMNSSEMLVGRQISSTLLEQQRRYDYYYLEAIRLKQLQQYDDSFTMLQHCLEINPHGAAALYEAAQYYLYLKQSKQAVEALERACAYEPQNFWYANALCTTYLQLNEREKAIDFLQSMTQRFPDKVDPLYTLLDLYTRSAKYDEVIAILDRLEKRLGKSEQLTMEKVNIYMQKGDKKEAMNEMKGLVKEYPQELRYQVMLGDIHLQNNEHDKAAAIYRQVLAEESDNAMALYSMANYYKQTNQDDLYNQQLDTLLLNKKVDSNTKLGIMRQLVVQNESTDRDSTRIVTLFDRIMKQEPDDPQIPLLYAQYLYNKKMTDKMVPVLNQVLDLDPTNSAARMTLLNQFIATQDYEALIGLCEGGVEAEPENLTYYYLLAISYAQFDRTDDMLAIALRAVPYINERSDKKLASDIYSVMGDCFHQKQQNAEAYQAYEQALKYNPDNIPVLNNYAYYLSLERKELDRAEEMSYRTVKAEPNNATYLDTYAWILFEKGNYAEARIYIDEAMKVEEGNQSDVVVEHCGDIYFMNGETDEAVKYWQKSLELGNESDVLKKKIKLKKYVQE